MMTARGESTLGPSQRAGLVTRLLDRIGNIWFGVTLLVLIFIYSSIGSAAPPIRQGALADWTGIELLRFDKTEMEWFSWWPLQVMLGLFCLAIILVTLRKIPLTLVNAGVWTIHTGILILTISSAIYFGTKVEGDTVIFQSKALMLAPGMGAPVSMIVRPQASADLVGAKKPYRISVQQMRPNFEIRTGQDQGKKTQAIEFEVDTGDRKFTRVVLVGYPDYTEDQITGTAGVPQWAMEVTGKKLVDEDLKIELDYDVSKYFYHAHAPPVRSTGAIYARFSPRDEWTQLRYDHLPHYYEHLAHQNELWVSPAEPFPPARASLDLKPESNPIGLDVRITDYLPFANIEQRWVDAGAEAPVNPYIRFRAGPPGMEQPHELLALLPDQRSEKLTEDLPAEFLWAATDAERQVAVAQPHPHMVVSVPSKKTERTIPLSELLDGKSAAIEGTDYHIELLRSGDDYRFPSLGLAAVRVTHGSQQYTRLIVSGEQGRSFELDDTGHLQMDVKDKDLQIKYLDPAHQRLLLVAGPGSNAIDLVLTMTNGLYLHQTTEVGKSLSLVPMLGVKIEQLLPRARSEMKPAIVPREQRESQQGKLLSLVRVEVNDGQAIQSVWLPFSQYAFDNEQWVQPERFRWFPRPVRLSDGRVLWLLYSQWRDPLPAPIALDRFVLETHTGGDKPSDYISYIRFLDDGKWSDLKTVRSNHPGQKGDKWFFQAQWDPGTEAYTVLGVGNRNGVYAMLTGVCISIAGMIYAFYFKPSIIRRRKRQALEAAEARGAFKKKRVEQPEVTHV